MNEDEILIHDKLEEAERMYYKSKELGDWDSASRYAALVWAIREDLNRFIRFWKKY